VSKLWDEKLIHRDADKKIVLTEPGLGEALRIAQSHIR
jgi:hypothetical protein